MRLPSNYWRVPAIFMLSTITVVLASDKVTRLFPVSKASPLDQSSQTLTGNSSWIYAVAISPDGQTLASGSYDKIIKIYHSKSGQLIHTIKGQGDAIETLAITPDGQKLISGSWDNTIKLWDLQTGKLLHTLRGHSDDVKTLAISPDGKTLASGSSDGTIRLWKIEKGRIKALLF